MQVFRTIAHATAAAGLALIGSAASAQQQGAPQPKPVTRAAVSSQLDSAFAAADTNHDGSLSAAEIQALEAKELQQVQATIRARLQAQFKELDTNKDGQLSQAEFLAAAPPASALVPGVEKMIATLDKNKDGKLSPDEFRAPQLSIFDKLDTNHDGTLSPTERAAGQAKPK